MRAAVPYAAMQQRHIGHIAEVAGVRGGGSTVDSYSSCCRILDYGTASSTRGYELDDVGANW